MPMSIVPVFSRAVATAASTPKAAARLVMIRISAKRPSSASRVEPGLNPNQPSHRISTPSPNRGMLCPGIARGLPSLPYLPLRGPSSSSAASAAGGADQVDRGRAGEVLHADDVGAEVAADLQEAAAEHPVGADRVDERAEDDRVDHVDAELDPLQRRAPDDRQRDGAEHELEEELRLDRRVGERHHGEARVEGGHAVGGRRVRAEVGEEEPAVVADERCRRRRRRRIRRPTSRPPRSRSW